MNTQHEPAPRETTKPLSVLQRLAAIRADVDGYIVKDKSVSAGAGGNYKAVTHDAIVAKVRSSFITHGVLVFQSLLRSVSLPKEVNANMETAKQFRYEATYEITFVNVDDANDKYTVVVEAHAMDNQDKAPGKAMSYAFKYPLLKVLMIESGEDEESRYQSEGVPEEELVGWIKRMETAGNVGELRKIYADAIQSVNDAKDRNAAKSIRAAFNARMEYAREKAGKA